VLSIIIVNWNTRQLLEACLASIQHNPPDFSFETWVVDNASQDDSVAMVQAQFPEVHLITNAENVGFARANNQALRQAGGEYLLLLNSDTEVHPGALQTLVDALQASPQAGAAGPQMLNTDGSLQNSYGSLPGVLDEFLGPYWLDAFTKPWGKFGSKLAERQLAKQTYLTVERVSFAGTLIRRVALEQVGLLDEDYLFYSEDYDWFMRLKKVGWQTIFCPQARISHHWGGSSKKNNAWALSHLYRSKRIYFFKHHGFAAKLLLQAGLTLRFLAKWLILSLPGRDKTEKTVYQQLIGELWT
jgi:GT2 family glycosyltransferase